MVSKREQALGILARLGSQPAVAFYEEGVASAIKAILVEMGLGFHADSYDNIIVRMLGQDPRQAPIAFVAHMDHPGFEAITTHEDCLVAKALGGVPASSFSAGVPVQVMLADGQRLRGTTAGRFGEEADRQVLVRLEELQPVELPRPVVFNLVDFALDGEFIHMRALDDLAGCASILAALATLSGQAVPGDVYGVFTRAEEVGLVGARLMAEAGTLPRETLVVSVESSRTLPGAAIGSGPVIRVGDATSTFNAQAESALIRARETLQARTPLNPSLPRGDTGGFKVQRQLMSGGTCEASAFALYGYRTTGIAFPLGNYHNGGSEGRIEAEYIHVDDFMGGVELMVAAVHGVPDREYTAARRRLREIPQEWRERLQVTAGSSPQRPTDR
jgi:endoglucanase